MNVNRTREFLAIAALSTACGAGSAGNAVKPDDPTAGDALGEPAGGGSPGVSCATVPATVEPLVVDWPSSAQLDLAVHMQESVAVVAYDCKSIKLLKNCTAPGAYSFAGVSSIIQEAVKMEDADEVQASLPFSGAAISGEVKRGAAIDIALAYVGKMSTQSAGVAAGDLTGSDCDKATHFVRRATLGAFTMETGTRGEARAAAEIFGAGSKGESTSKKKKLNSAGDPRSCKSSDGAAKPPEGCSAILRLELQALGEARVEDKKAPLANDCPDGFLRANGRCAKRETAGTYRCDMTDPQECKDQCKKGNAESCYNAGTIADGNEPKPVTKALYTKACAGNVARACMALTDFIDKMPDWPDAWNAGSKACDLGLADACAWMGWNGDNGGMGKGIDARAGYYKRACDLGKYESCNEVAEIWLEGKWNAKVRTADALALLDHWCDGGSYDACRTLTKAYKDGEPYNNKTEIQPDPKKFEQYHSKACATKDPRRLEDKWIMSCK